MDNNNASKASSTASLKVPPGPSETLVVNDLKQDSLKYLLHYTNTYGDIVHYRADAWSMILINHPNYIKHVLQDNPQNYTKAGTPDLLMLKPMLGSGLMTSEGESWAQQRHLLQPGFHRERIDAFGTLMTEATHKMLDQWQPFAARGEPLEIADQMTRLTLQIVAQALFSTEMSHEADNFGQAVGIMNEFMAHFNPYDPARMRQFQAAIATLNQLVHTIIQNRHRQNEDLGDLLSMLMLAQDETGEGMSDRQIQDQVCTLLMAGHETTAKALTWTLYLLDQHPAVERQLRQELRIILAGRTATCRDLPNLSYTWMVIQEAMRLYPPVWSMSRLCRKDDEMGGYHIPAGSLVLISPYAMHRHPAFWKNPDQFDPDRFNPETVNARVSYAYLPFGGGQRQCIGRAFASVETQLVLATILQRYYLNLVPGHPVEPEALVTLRPQFNLPMFVHSAA